MLAQTGGMEWVLIISGKTAVMVLIGMLVEIRNQLRA
jgi:hypothetical protein